MRGTVASAGADGLGVVGVYFLVVRWFVVIVRVSVFFFRARRRPGDRGGNRLGEPCG